MTAITKQLMDRQKCTIAQNIGHKKLYLDHVNLNQQKIEILIILCSFLIDRGLTYGIDL